LKGFPLTKKPDWWQRLTVIGGLASALIVGVGLYKTSKDSTEQLRLATQGQVPDRFAKARPA